MKVERFSANPIVYPGLDGSLGSNINGPSLIKVPNWLPDPLGRYYLYLTLPISETYFMSNATSVKVKLSYGALAMSLPLEWHVFTASVT